MAPPARSRRAAARPHKVVTDTETPGGTSAGKGGKGGGGGKGGSAGKGGSGWRRRFRRNLRELGDWWRREGGDGGSNPTRNGGRSGQRWRHEHRDRRRSGLGWRYEHRCRRRSGARWSRTGSNLCDSNADCSDGTFCNGPEQCVGVGQQGADERGCAAGTPVTCLQDNYACTTQFCDEDLDECTTVVNDVICDDGKFCNGAERCDPESSKKNAQGCVVAADNSLPCSDGIACTVDSCDEDEDRCEFTPSDDACNDPDPCDGQEICDPMNAGAGNKTGCIAGPPLDCEDEYGCTENTCVPYIGCTVQYVHSLCDDDILCTADGKIEGEELCDPVGDPADGCVDTAPVSCTGQRRCGVSRRQLQRIREDVRRAARQQQVQCG